MTMIPLSSLATPGFRQASPPWGHCIRISRRPFREPRGPYHLVTACSLGLLQQHPGAVLPNKAPTGFLPCGPCLRPIAVVRSTPSPIQDLAREPDHRGTGHDQSREYPCTRNEPVGSRINVFARCLFITQRWLHGLLRLIRHVPCFEKSSYIRPYIVQTRKNPATKLVAGFLYKNWGG